MPEARRAFFALWPPAGLAQGLARLISGLPGRASLAEDIHLTLAFVGDLDQASLERLQAHCADLVLPRTELRVGGLGYWQHNHILWAALAAWPAPLAAFVTELHARLAAAGLPQEARPFMPHLTLLRQAALPACLALPGALPAWPVKSWHLAAASGAGPGLARYRCLVSWPAA